MKTGTYQVSICKQSMSESGAGVYVYEYTDIWNITEHAEHGVAVRARGHLSPVDSSGVRLNSRPRSPSTLPRWDSAD
jgi:hypothetical protein